MKKNRKRASARVLSVLMTLAMIVGLMPTAAFADEGGTVKLDTGSYTVTANLYVKATDNTILGINAYLTNPALPPINPVSENATLNVAENGEMTLKLNRLNDIFTLQEIGGCADAEITDQAITEDVQWPQGYEGEKKISSRISSLDIKLKKAVDQYVFTSCKEYPTLLASSSSEGYWNVPLTLEVDFDSAYISFDDKAEGLETYTVSNNGATVSVETSDTQMKNAMQTAQLTAANTNDNDTITRLLKEKYDSEPSYTAYTLSMDTEWKGNTRATITLPTTLTIAMHVYRLNGNDTLSEVGYYQWNKQTMNASVNTKNISYDAESKTISFQASQLGTYIILDISNNYEYQIVEYPAAGSGVSYKMTDSTRWTQNPSNYNMSKYIDYQEVKPIAPKVQTIDGVGTAYSVGFSTKNSTGYMVGTYSQKLNDEVEVPCYKVELTVPGNANSKAYFITEDGQEFSPASLGAEPLACTVSEDGKVVVTVCEITSSATSTTAINRIKLMEQRLHPDCVASSNGLSDMTGYVLVTDKEIAGMPITKLSSSKKEIDGKYINGNALSYTSSIIKPANKIQNTNEDVTFSGMDNLKDAGEYPVTAVLPEGKYWADGTQGNKTINLLVRKKNLKASYSGETIKEGETPTLTVKVSNWGSGDKELKEDPDSQPTLTAPENLKIGKYELTPNCPELKNYYWTVTSGVLTVLPKDAQEGDQLADIPAAITDLTENGTEQTGVADADENAGYTITGNKATKAGSYTATATLKEGYWWTDGTREPKTIAWSIAEKKSQTGGNTGGNTGGSTTTTEKTEKAIANLYVPGELNKQLPGVTAYLTNPDNPVGTTASNIPDGWKFKSAAPTSPMNVNNAVLKTDKSGKKTLTVQVCNPVFTLQSIEGTSSNGSAKVIDTKTEKGDFGGKKSRITEVTFEILKDADRYVFENCVEYPTLLSTEWTVPLTLVINDIDKLPSTDGSKVDTGSTGGGSGSAVTPTTPATPGAQTATGKFKDVADSAYYKKAVDWAVEKNVTSGATADTFAPDKICTRAQTVTFLWRAAGSPEPALVNNPFTDVSSDAYYYKAVLWAVEKGITKGMTETTFAPDKTVTRGQVVTFQWRLAGSPAVEGSGGFTDVASDSYCGDAVKWAAKNGITSGKSASTFAPDEGCTRAQIVTFLYRQLGAASGK